MSSSRNNVVWVVGILLMFCAPTIIIGAMKGKGVIETVLASLLAIAGTLFLNFMCVLPSIGSSSNPHYFRPGTDALLLLSLLISYGLQFAIQMA